LELKNQLGWTELLDSAPTVNTFHIFWIAPLISSFPFQKEWRFFQNDQASSIWSFEDDEMRGANPNRLEVDFSLKRSTPIVSERQLLVLFTKVNQVKLFKKRLC